MPDKRPDAARKKTQGEQKALDLRHRGLRAHGGRRRHGAIGDG